MFCKRLNHFKTFLMFAGCWCHPTHRPTLRNVLRYLKRLVRECGLGGPPSGHVTKLINNLHYFCWPSLSVDVFFHFGFLLKFFDFSCEFEFCGGTSVLTMSPQDKIRKLQRKSAFMPILFILFAVHYL